MDIETRNSRFGFDADCPNDIDCTEHSVYSNMDEEEDEEEDKPVTNFCPGCDHHDCDNCDL